MLIRMNGVEVEVAGPEEAAQLLRKLGLAPSPPKVQHPIPQQAGSLEQSSNASTEVQEPYNLLRSRLSGSQLRLLEALTDADGQWIEASTLQGSAGIKLKGVGTVIRSIEKTAKELKVPNPIKKEAQRVGKSRVTKLKVTSAFLASEKGKA